MTRPKFFREVSAPFDRMAIIKEWLVTQHYLEWCSEYGEPGYSQPETGVMLANWNPIPRTIMDYLEAQGFELEWSDEWTINYNSSKAYRTSPSSYDWESSVVYYDGEPLFRDDDDPADIIEAIAMTDWNQEAGCVPSWITPSDLEEVGYVKVNHEDFESGWFPGQTDDPAKIAKAIWNGPKRVERLVFRKVENSQFYCKFECWALYEEGVCVSF